MTQVKVLLTGMIGAKGMLNLLMDPDSIPDDVYVDMHDGRLMPARRFFRECAELVGLIKKER